MSASPAASTQQFHPGHDRTDRRQVDMIVTMPAALGLAGNVASAMAAGSSYVPLDLVRRFRKGAMLAFTRRTLARLRLAAFASAPAEIILRGRDMRVLRRLARLADQFHQFGNPRRHTLDHIVLREQKLVLLGFAQGMKRRWRHA